jgi:hypothetical protein
MEVEGGHCSLLRYQQRTFGKLEPGKLQQWVLAD